eukprot:gene49776-60933_t
MTQEALEENHIINQIKFVEDGVDLIDYLRQNGKFNNSSEFPRPDLILLDLNMPKKDGRETLKEIKANPLFKKIPVIILTTSKAEEDVNLCYSSGAN